MKKTNYSTGELGGFYCFESSLIETNIYWQNDFDQETLAYFEQSDLVKYL